MLSNPPTPAACQSGGGKRPLSKPCITGIEVSLVSVVNDMEAESFNPFMSFKPLGAEVHATKVWLPVAVVCIGRIAFVSERDASEPVHEKVFSVPLSSLKWITADLSESLPEFFKRTTGV